MLPGLRMAVIADPVRFSNVKVMYPVPDNEGPWGVLRPLKGTSWGEQISTVSGEALSHALHGEPKFLREQLGRPPIQQAKRLPVAQAMCLHSQMQECAFAKPHCRPGSGKLPDCYTAPSEDAKMQSILWAVARAWDDGRYVFVVEGPEFRL